MRASLFKRGRLYHAKIQLPTWTNEKRVSLETTDKRVAAMKLEKLVRDFELVDQGKLAPLAVREAAAKALADLCESFVVQLDAAKLTGTRYRSCLKIVREENQWTHLTHVTESAFRRWFRESKLRASTRNDYLAIWKGLFKWLRRERMVTESPLEFIDKLDETRTSREFRRALAPDEVATLLACTGIPKTRRTIYRVLLETGLRGKELRGLRVGDFNFGEASYSRPGGGAEPALADRPRSGDAGVSITRTGQTLAGPSVRVPASLAKNRKVALLPLDPQTAAEVRQLIAPDAPAFNFALQGLVPRNDTFRRDLAAAGIACADTMGRRVDLHALRKSYGTALVLAGAEPRVVMEAMRHADLKLTMQTYMDAAQLAGPVAAAVASLPWRRGEAERQAEKA
jgi:integrase